MTVMDIAALEEMMAAEFPQAARLGAEIESLDDAGLRLRLAVAERHLRPGGTVSGPVMMELCDLAMYLLLLSRIGPVALAVTTSLNINFMRKPEGSEIVADARLMKLGRRLAVGEVTIAAPGEAAIAAHATLTYAIPPKTWAGT